MRTVDRAYRGADHHRGPKPNDLARRTRRQPGDTYADATLRDVAEIRAHRRAVRRALVDPPDPRLLSTARPLP